ncbi:MAG TPA: RNA polymerase sigma factor [Trebonia sp.]|nr:RNA polymerase sigma factor [Trebonia sp.]
MHDSDVSVPTAPGVGSPGASADIAWVSEAYDSFAEALYPYCRSLVREPAAAADAVRDTFVVTAFRLDDLPGEGLLRPWLYAVARNECLRAISDGQAAAAVDFLPNEVRTDSQPPAQLPEEEEEEEEEAAPAAVADTDAGACDDTSPDLMAGAENDRALLWAALGGLNPADRDLMVMAWHGLDITECAFVLGVSRDAAFKAFSRARGHLEKCAGALVVARSEARACGPLNAMLDGWDGRLTPALSTGLGLHIDRCDICASARRGWPSPVLLRQLSPDAMRTMAVTAGTSQLTRWVTSRLRDQVLAAAFGQELESFEHRAMVVRRAGPFRDDGFPVALLPGGLAAGRKRRSPMVLTLAGAGGTGLAAVIALAALSLSGNHSTGILQAWEGLAHPAVITSAGSASASVAPGTSPSLGGTASASPSPRPAATTPRAATTTPGSKPSASTSASAKPSAQPSRTSPSGGPASSSPTTTAAAAVQSGLNVSATSLTLQEHWGAYGGTLTLRNPTGSAIGWSVSIPDGSHLALWGPRSAQLQPGKTATLSFYLQGRPSGGSGNSQPSTAVVTIDPGNIQVSVTIP